MAHSENNKQLKIYYEVFFEHPVTKEKDSIEFKRPNPMNARVAALEFMETNVAALVQCEAIENYLPLNLVKDAQCPYPFLLLYSYQPALYFNSLREYNTYLYMVVDNELENQSDSYLIFTLNTFTDKVR